MNKAILKASSLAIFLAPALLFAGAPLAQAQVYSTYGTTVYPTSYSTPVYSTPTYTQPTSSCIELTAPMTIGASDYLNGGQVSELQTFLVRDNMLSSAYVTGYYGSLTASAVAQFQASRGISPVGVVGPATRAAIAQVSCGNSGIISPAQPVYPVNPISPANPIYPINPGGPIIYSRPDLNSLSVSYSGSSAVITIQGYGFGATNTVVFGNESIAGVSSNGSQLSFNVPSVVPGNYEIYVTNQYGSSNSLSYTVGNNNNNGGSSCYLNGVYSTCTGCVPVAYNPLNGYNANSSYNNCGSNSNGTVILNSINGSGTSGAAATIYGSGFTSNSNTVYFGGQVISNVYSSNGTSISFNVPYVSYSNGNSYSVYVVNGNGVTSNTIQFNVNGTSYNNGQIDISYLSPTGGNIGTQIAIVGSGFSQYGNIVHFGNGGSMNVSSTNGSTIYYNIPSSIAPCDVNTNGNVCATYAQLVTAGTYPIYVTNQNGATSNTVDFQVFN